MRTGRSRIHVVLDLLFVFLVLRLFQHLPDSFPPQIVTCLPCNIKKVVGIILLNHSLHITLQMCHLFIFFDHSFNNTECQPEKSYTVCFVAISWVFIDGRSYENLDRGECVSVTVRVWAEYKFIERERERERMSGDSWKHWNNSRTYELFSQTRKVHSPHTNELSVRSLQVALVVHSSSSISCSPDVLSVTFSGYRHGIMSTVKYVNL